MGPRATSESLEQPRSTAEADIARVLLVDDDATYLALCRRYLGRDSKHRYEIVTASGAAEAIVACENRQFDCLLIDYRLPDVTGPDLIETLRARLGAALPPVVIISADGGTDAVVDALRSQADDFLTKREVTLGALRRSIGNAVEKGRLRRAVLRRREELQRANAELERRAIEIQRFYHTVSHEMKTPLTAAREFVAIVRDGIVGEVRAEQRELLDHALACCDQITTQFNDLIDLTRLETGKMRLERCPSALAEIARRALAMCAAAARERAITLEHAIAEDLPPLDADGGRIAQVLSNLLGNAIKFTPPGGRVALGAALGPDARTVEIAVSDTGCGIAEHDLERVFDRLYQVRDSAEGGGGGGLGLGLSIAREIVRGHGGELVVESRVGQGSTFSFALPVAGASATNNNNDKRAQRDEATPR